MMQANSSAMGILGFANGVGGGIRPPFLLPPTFGGGRMPTILPPLSMPMPPHGMPTQGMQTQGMPPQGFPGGFPMVPGMEFGMEFSDGNLGFLGGLGGMQPPAPLQMPG